MIQAAVDNAGTIDWGDVPTWIGSIGAVSAAGWAVFLYNGTVRDQRRAQARLLSPVGDTVPVQDLVGTPVVGEAVAPMGSIGLDENRRLVLIAEHPKATIHLVSTSSEPFTDVSVWLDMPDREEVSFPLGFDAIAPHEEKIATAYFEPGIIAGSMPVRVQFRDANGRRWEKSSNKPLRQLPTQSEPARLLRQLRSTMSSRFESMTGFLSRLRR
jgi:hypothetical protein